MSQRGFTILEMMLILLLMGITAGLVLMSFPDSAQNHLQQQRERLQAQLDYALDRSQQDGLLMGIQVRFDGWKFKVLQRGTAESPPTLAEGGDIWQGYVWQTCNRDVQPWGANFRMMCVLSCSISEVCSGCLSMMTGLNPIFCCFPEVR